MRRKKRQILSLRIKVKRIKTQKSLILTSLIIFIDGVILETINTQDHEENNTNFSLYIINIRIK